MPAVQARKNPLDAPDDSLWGDFQRAFPEIQLLTQAYDSASRYFSAQMNAQQARDHALWREQMRMLRDYNGTVNQASKWLGSINPELGAVAAAARIQADTPIGVPFRLVATAPALDIMGQPLSGCTNYSIVDGWASYFNGSSKASAWQTFTYTVSAPNCDTLAAQQRQYQIDQVLGPAGVAAGGLSGSLVVDYGAAKGWSSDEIVERGRAANAFGDFMLVLGGVASGGGFPEVFGTQGALEPAPGAGFERFEGASFQPSSPVRVFDSHGVEATVPNAGGSAPTSWWEIRNPTSQTEMIQQGPNTCGSACAANMANSMGFDDITEQSMVEQVGLENVGPGPLARALTQQTGRSFQGGALPFDISGMADSELTGLVNGLTRNGDRSFMALFEREGGIGNGHWVNVMGTTAQGLVNILDPVGLIYQQSLNGFRAAFRYGNVVF